MIRCCETRLQMLLDKDGDVHCGACNAHSIQQFLTSVTVALAFDEQIITAVPTTEDDESVDAVITPTKMYSVELD